MPKKDSPSKDFLFTEGEYAIISEAALSRGMEVGEYVRFAVLKVATEEVGGHQPTLLSDRDWDRLTSDLEDPPAPNEKLRRLLGG